MKLCVTNEFGRLKKVLVADAITYFDHAAINDNQSLYYKLSPPVKALLLEQQKTFFKVLEDNGVELIFATPMYDCPDQLNTRDPSFVIGDTFFVSAMKESLRVGEKQGLEELIKKIDGNVVFLTDCTIEGGDIVLNGHEVFVGISRRTTLDGVTALKRCLPKDYAIVPIKLKKGFLHLDTVFNIVSPSDAIICSEALEEDSVGIIQQQFNCIDISLEEQLHLGTNVFSIAPGKIISQKFNVRINEQLRNRGYEVIEIEYSEAAKLGGAFRCGTCPLIRESL